MFSSKQIYGGLMSQPIPSTRNQRPSFLETITDGLDIAYSNCNEYCRRKISKDVSTTKEYDKKLRIVIEIVEIFN